MNGHATNKVSDCKSIARLGAPKAAAADEARQLSSGATAADLAVAAARQRLNANIMGNNNLDMSEGEHSAKFSYIGNNGIVTGDMHKDDKFILAVIRANPELAPHYRKEIGDHMRARTDRLSAESERIRVQIAKETAETELTLAQAATERENAELRRAQAATERAKEELIRIQIAEQTVETGPMTRGATTMEEAEELVRSNARAELALREYRATVEAKELALREYRATVEAKELALREADVVRREAQLALREDRATVTPISSHELVGAPAALHSQSGGGSGSNAEENMKYCILS